VFNQSLELWLELRKEINLTLKGEGSENFGSESQEANKNFMDKKFEDGNIYEIFELKFAEKCQPILISKYKIYYFFIFFFFH
jgi:hypothetical protein